MSKTELLPILIDGKWKEIKTKKTYPVYNPSRGEKIAEVPDCSAKDLDQVVKSASKAFIEWSQTPPNTRAQYFYRLKMELEDNFLEISKLISKEHGKTLTEAKGDLRRGIEVVEFACGVPTLLMGEHLTHVANGIDCTSDRHPLGVVAGICPFNFPALVPMWMWPVAIACGNCFILKPSEKVPLTSHYIAKLMLKVGFPKGVFSIIHGGKDMVDAILEHPEIKAISFVGSTPIAKYIYQKGCHNGKRVQAAGGAKNFVFIMEDANVEETVNAIRDGAFGCAGERCMASSTAVAVGNASKTILPSLYEAISELKTGPTDVAENLQPHMGAVITREHADKVNSLVSLGEKNGAKIPVDGRKFKNSDAPDGFFVAPSVVDEIDYNNPLSETEIFGPVLSVFRANKLEEAIALANRQKFGNGSAIFTTSGKSAREFRHRVNTGMVGINIAVPAPLAYFPFTGWNESFYGDLHIQGKEGVAFYTKQKVTTTRWFSAGEGDIWYKR